MESVNIKIAKDFSDTPGPRYENEGKFSGEKFRKEVLEPTVRKALKEGKKIKVDLDHTAGYGTSFLEEAFGGLIRNDKIEYKRLKESLELKSEEEEYLIDDINEYLREAYDETEKNSS